MMIENRLWKNLLLVLSAVSFSVSALMAQCTTGLGTGTASSQGLFGEPWRQSFQVSCTGQLTTIVMNPTNSGSAMIDELTPIDNVNTSLRLLNASNVVIANATINGLPHTNTWGAGNTYTFDFSAANVTLNANTTYSWELYNVELNSNQPIGVTYLAITNLTNPYALGNANVGGINYASADIHNWTVNVVAACASPVITTQPTNVTATVGGTANFNVSATGTNLTYQWQYAAPGSSVFNDIVSATGSSYSAPASNIGRYRVKVYSNGGCEVISNPATLTSPDYFVLQFTGATSYVFSSLTAGNVNYTYLTKNGLSGTGSFNSASLTTNNVTINTPSVASNDSLTLVIEPTNLQQLRTSTDNATRLQLYNVKQWGSVVWTSLYRTFNNCGNLKVTATDAPNFTMATNIKCMFKQCFVLDSIPNINNWNVGTVQRFDSLFNDCHLFDGNLSNWNMSSALSTSAMFAFAGKYNNGGNPGINNWNMSNVTSMGFMFSQATNFNQPIGNWDVGNVLGFSRVFQGATNFNQDISNWDVSSSGNFQRFLTNATSFNQNLSKWTFSSATINLNEMFGNCGMSCANYSATLIGWASNPNLPTGRGLGSVGRIYGTDAQAARTFLTTPVASGGKGWTISGDSPGGAACIPNPVLSTISNQETCDGQSISNISFTLGGDTTNVAFTTLSSNPAITPMFTFNGPASARTLNIATTAGQIGATTISIIATNSLGGKDTTTFLLELGNQNTTTGSSVVMTYLTEGSINTFTVPANVFSINVQLSGGNGGAGFASVSAGGRMTADLSVTPGEVLTLYVGSNGSNTVTGTGYGNGSMGGGSLAGNGGGSTAIISGSTPYAVAGGGGGGGGNGTVGGHGGGLGNGNSPGGAGGPAFTIGSNGSYYTHINATSITNNAFGVLNQGIRISYIPTIITYSACNAKPTFNPATIANSSNCFSTSTITLPTQSITVSDSDGSIASTVVSSSNPTLIGVTNTGTATNVVLSMTQFANQSGSAVIKVLSTDNLGAKDSISFTVTVNSMISPVASIGSNYNGSPISCYGAIDGSVSVAVSGGVMPYTYLWSNGSNTSTNPGVGAGTYSVVVTDANGCTKTSNTVTVTEPAALSTSTITTTQISCFGANNGAINVSPAGGSGAYSFSWSDGPSTEDRSGLSAGTYTVGISDLNGCSTSFTSTITEPAAIVSAVTASSCDSYTLNGQTYTTSGTYTQILTAVNGCDSTLTLNLTVLNSTNATIFETACELVTVNGSTFTTSGTYTQYLTNAAGCDSTLTIEVTILEPTAATLTLSECDSLTLNGETFTASGVYTQLLTNAAGCDSVLTINLSINNSVYDTLTVEACGEYTFNNVTYTASGSYDQLLVAANGCSLYQTLNVTIFPVVDLTAVYNGDSTFTATGADTYQWIDCITGQPIAGATSATFTAPFNGDYAVIGTSNNGCSETSACISVDNLSTKINEQLNLVLAPNPTSNAVALTFNAATATVVIYDAQGKILQVKTISSGDQLELGAYQTGVYLLEIRTELGVNIERVVKQ